MILILEDDADRAAYRRMGNPFNAEFFDPELKNPTIWISPEAYAEEVGADLRAKVQALRWFGIKDVGIVVMLDDVLTLLEEKQ